jgi:hypothetical protein
MQNSSESKRADFFAVTQSEFFLLIIFIVLSYSIFQLGKVDEVKVENANLSAETTSMQDTICNLRDSLNSLRTRATSLMTKLDSILIFTNTGIGNCLDQGYLAELTIDGEDLLSCRFLVDQRIGNHIIAAGSEQRFNRHTFSKFGQAVLEFSKNQIPECRFSIRIRDSEFVSKQQLKSIYTLSNKYFNAMIVQ